jgi:hypothetical protein
MRRRWIYKNGEAIEIEKYEPEAQAYIMPDLKPYQSMADGSMIMGRRQHREHLREHNCIEIGNEVMEAKKPQQSDNRREVLRAQLANMTNRDADKILHKLREEARFTRR